MNGAVRIDVALMVMAAEIDVSMSVRVFEELTQTQPKPNRVYSVQMRSGLDILTSPRIKTKRWRRSYFYIKVDEAGFEDPQGVDRRFLWSNDIVGHPNSFGSLDAFRRDLAKLVALRLQEWRDFDRKRIRRQQRRIARFDWEPYIPCERTKGKRLKLPLRGTFSNVYPDYAKILAAQLGDTSFGSETNVVESIILRLLKQWIDEKLKTVQECFSRAKEAETWNPKSKSEAYAQSAGELMKLAKDAIAEFFEVPIGITENLVHDLAEGIEQFFKEDTTFVASCGSKQSYIPTLPPLTRCNRDSKFVKLLKKAMPCTVSSGEDLNSLSGGALGVSEGHHPCPSTSRGTQRLYIRSGFDGSASGRTLASVLPSRPRADRRRFREFEEALFHVRGRVDTGRGSGSRGGDGGRCDILS
ncbi:hypothetical protein Bca4012_038624 [Brassica carinata]